MNFAVFGELEFEKDLLQSEELPELIKNKKFAVKLYSTLCNNIFYKGNSEFFPSWRYAGGLVAYLRQLLLNYNEKYTDFYLSGNEGEIFPEIENFLEKLGWKIEKT